jgi:hypothetical protein
MTSTTLLTPLRYDSPTVTLEVSAREAAVSQWSDKPVVQVLRYQLYIRPLGGEGDPVELRGDRASFVPLMEAVQAYIQAQLLGNVHGSDRLPSVPYLEPQGLTQHSLHLGHLRTSTGASTIHLGAVQLADFGEVLDQLDAAVRPLPVPLTPTRQRRSWKRWGAVAAGMVAAVGVTTTLWPNYQTRQGVGDTALEAPTAEQAPAVMPDAESEARSPQPETATDSTAADSAETTPDAGNLTGEAASPTERDETTSAAGSPNPPINPAAPQPAPRSTPKTTAPAPASTPSAAEPAAPADEATTTTPDTPDRAPEVQEPASSPQTATRAPAREIAPHRNAPTASSTESADTLAANEGDTEEAGATAEDSPETFALPTEPPNVAGAPEPGSLAALVEMVRDRWQPPADLNQTLIYTLVFAADGTLVDVIPADDLAAQYLDRTGIPEIGTEWRPSGDPQQVDLLLHPNGNVDFRDAAPAQ